MFTEDFIIVDTAVVPPEGDGATGVPPCAPDALGLPPYGLRSLFSEGLVYLPVTYQANTYFPQHGGPPPQSPEYQPGPMKR